MYMSMYNYTTECSDSVGFGIHYKMYYMYLSFHMGLIFLAQVTKS